MDNAITWTNPKTEIAASMNRIDLSGEFKQFKVENKINSFLNSSKISKTDAIKFDLSSTTYFDMGTLLWFISYLNKLKSSGLDIQLLFPAYEGSGKTNWDFLKRFRFFEALSECVDDPINLLLPEQVAYASLQSKYSFPKDEFHEGEGKFLKSHFHKLLEITPLKAKYNTSDELRDFISRMYNILIFKSLHRACGWSYEDTSTYAKQIFGEGLKNSFKYSGGSFVLVGQQSDSKNITLAICDNGKGIPNSLRAAFGKNEKLRTQISLKTDFELIELYADSELIKFSTENDVSSDINSTGMGLFHLKNTVLKFGGELRIRSGNACVDFKNSGVDVHSSQKFVDYPGTLLRIQTPLK